MVCLLLLQIQVPFDRYFRVEPLQKYHRVMTMERFMTELAPMMWPPGNRTGNSCAILFSIIILIIVVSENFDDNPVVIDRAHVMCHFNDFHNSVSVGQTAHLCRKPVTFFLFLRKHARMFTNLDRCLLLFAGQIFASFCLLTG